MDKGIFNTSMTEGPEYGYTCNGDFANNFPLGVDYIGPNIHYWAWTLGLSEN